MDRAAWQATVHGITESDTTERLMFSLLISNIILQVLTSAVRTRGEGRLRQGLGCLEDDAQGRSEG